MNKKQNFSEEVRSEMDSLFPLLNGLDKDQQWNVPNDYFEKLTDSVIEKAHESDAKPKVISLWRRSEVQMIAASLLILLSIVLFWPASTEQEQTVVEKTDIIDFVDYAIANVDDVDVDLLVELQLLSEEGEEGGLLLDDEIFDSIDSEDIDILEKLL